MFTESPLLQNEPYPENSNPGRQNDGIAGSLPVTSSLTTPAGDPLGLIASSINKLLLDKVPPENIICFVLNDPSGTALQEQLMEPAKPDNNKVSITTICNFCEKFVLENNLSTDNLLTQVSLLESIQLLKKLIAGFPKNHPLKRYRSDVYHEINNLKRLFSFIKVEGLAPALLNQKIDSFLTMLTGKADEVEAGEMMEKLRAAVNEFDHYQTLLRMNNRCDENDLIRLVINCLEENKDLLSIYRKKFQFFHSAIGQPAGYLENRLLQLLTGNKGYPCPFPVDNSGQNAVISTGNENEFANPLIKKYNSAVEEMAGTVGKVYQIILQNVHPGKIAILYREDDYCETLEQHFRLKNIPFHSCRNLDILEHPFIGKIIQLLRYTSVENTMPYSGDHLLFEILHFDFYQVSSAEIAQLTVDANRKKNNLSAKGIRKLLRENANAPARDLFDTGLNKELKNLSLFLESLILQGSVTSPQQLFTNIIHNTYLCDYIGKNEDSDWLRQLLNTLENFIRTETNRNRGLQLRDLVEVLDTMEKERIPLPVSRAVGNATDVQLVNTKDYDRQEFDYLFFTGANELRPENEGWLNGIGKLGCGVSGLLSDENKRQDQILQQLFYQVRQRSAPYLFISFVQHDDSNAICQPAKLLTKIIGEQSLSVLNIEPRDSEWLKYGTLNKEWSPEIAPVPAALIAPAIDKFVMSVSALNNFLSCPLGFYYKNILRIPKSYEEAMEFGSAVHAALEKLFRRMASGNLYGQPTFQYRLSHATELVEDFKNYMQSNRSRFTSEAFDRRLVYGEEVLRDYYDHYNDGWNRVVSVERNISGVIINGVPLKGKLDKLEFNGKEVTVVDYKTGNMEKGLAKMKPPDDNVPNGGDYWRQAVFYKILVDHYEQKDWKVVDTEFDFIEPGADRRYHKEKILINAADIETVKQQIVTAWANIHASEFYTGCGRKNCHWCNFVKNNRLAIALHPIEKTRTGD